MEKFLALLILATVLTYCGISHTTTIVDDFSSGNRIVTLEKISYKGLMYKTYEGKGILQGFSTDSDGNIVRKTFNFSTNKAVFDSLKNHVGKKVNLYYNQALIRAYREGSSSYMVYKFEIIE